MRAALLALLVLAGCQTGHEVDPAIEREVICSMLTCGR